MPHLASADNRPPRSPCQNCGPTYAINVCVVNVVDAFAFDDTAAATVLLIFARR